MGCDGGTHPKRDELVRQKKKPEQKDKNAANMAKWRHCALKHEALQRPIVMDSHGLLYNKDAILEYIIDRTQFEHGPSHVRKLKDVKELNLTENPSFKSNHSDLGTEYLDVYSSPFTCPLTGLEMNGKYKFCALWTCGCVMSDRALRTVNGQTNKATTSTEKLSCPSCGQEYSNDDVLILNPEDEDIVLMDQRRERVANSASNQKKSNSSTKRKIADNDEEASGQKNKTEKIEADNPAVVSASKKSKSEAVPMKTSKVAPVQGSKSGAASIQQDPQKSDLYKSLFTSSEVAKEKEKNKAHWVTFNPLYF